MNFQRLIILSFIILYACSKNEEVKEPIIQQEDSYWEHAQKTAIGTSYEKYRDNQYQDGKETGTISKVWFSLAGPKLTETMFGLIHEAQFRSGQVIIFSDDGFALEEDVTNTSTNYLSTDEEGVPLSLAYETISQDVNNRFEIVKHYFTDPESQSLFLRIKITSNDKNLRFYYFGDPQLSQIGNDDHIMDHYEFVDSENALYIKSNVDFADFGSFSKSGYIKKNYKQMDLSEDNFFINDKIYYSNPIDAGIKGGNVGFLYPLYTNKESDLIFGFGKNIENAKMHADLSYKRGYQTILDNYNGKGDFIGWHDYLASLSHIDSLKKYSGDKGKLLYVSAMVLKASEDKSYAGALIASLSYPWGNSSLADEKRTGYKAVWPRDFFQCASALVALGDGDTAKASLNYLPYIQVHKDFPNNNGATGWFVQKTSVDQIVEWSSIQLDQTAMPIMLAGLLKDKNIIDDGMLYDLYLKSLRDAALFLVNGGKIDYDWNKEQINPPYTQQERWEEQQGYSPSTIASILAGLVRAWEFALLFEDFENAEIFKKAAESNYKKLIDLTTITDLDGNKYFVRVNPVMNKSAQEAFENNAKLLARNGQKELDMDKIIDPGFLELVRYGILHADNEIIQNSLKKVDDLDVDDYYKVRYIFTDGESKYSGYRRYGGDGYGETVENGLNYGENGKMHPDQRGRVWPFLTGERGTFELQKMIEAGEIDKNKIIDNYVKAMEYFANDSFMLPEQVHDNVGKQTKQFYEMGEGTNSATPLAWAHAEYIKLLKSLADDNVWDRPKSTSEFFIGHDADE